MQGVEKEKEKKRRRWFGKRQFRGLRVKTAPRDKKGQRDGLI